MGSNLWQALNVFSLFRLLENETMEMVYGRTKQKQA